MVVKKICHLLGLNEKGKYGFEKPLTVVPEHMDVRNILLTHTVGHEVIGH